MHPSAVDPIDTHRLDFLSYAPSAGGLRSAMEEIRVSVEPEIGDRHAEDVPLVQLCFPLRPVKIQRPILTDETLPRDRLFDWLGSKASRRVIYVIAEAGFGKTTLVADYLRRSRLRTFWYRLDEEETDGLVFLRYVVAACRAVDAGLLVRSAALLSESTFEPIGQDAVLETFLAEIEGLAEIPSALVLDDFHMVESVPAIGSIVERLIARLPASVQLVVVSRRTPTLSIAALRARGELAELEREELRFDEAETSRLFRDFYHHALEPDVLRDVQQRTEGWAASLQLIKTAVDGRSPGQVRAFVSSLSGAEGDLYDYLAEEVVGDLEPEVRNFLVRTAILEDIEPETAAVAAGVSPGLARRLLAACQRLGLASRSDDERGTWRSHPLVREFLLSHLEEELGEAGVAEMHRRLATILEPRSWRLAARHWAAAGDATEVRRVVSEATPTIIGTGDLAAAYEFVTRFPGPDPNPWFDVIRTRQLLALGHSQEALEGAQRLARLAADGTITDPGLAAAVGLAVLHVGISRDDVDLSARGLDALKRNEDRELAVIAEATEALYEAAEAGSVDRTRAVLLAALRLNRERGHSMYEGVSLLNLSNTCLALGDPHGAIAAGTEALSVLRSCGRGGDIAAAHMNVAKGMAHLGHWEMTQSHIRDATERDAEFMAELFGEGSELEAMYGDPTRASALLSPAFSEDEHRPGDAFCRYVAARIALEHGRLAEADELLSEIRGTAIVPGLRSSRLSLDLQVRATVNPADPSLPAAFEAALDFAQRQQAWFWWKCIRLTRALVSPGDALADYVRSLDPQDVAYLSIQAELVVRRLADLDDQALEIVRAEATLRPERWRWALRPALADSTGPREVRRAVELLEIVGDADDIPRLQALRKKRTLRLPNAGRALCRRLAPRAYVEDLGRISIRIGDRVVPGTEIRKKVLALLCFLLTRPQFTATREQVFEALWPEMDPEASANSLNQSAYFLRRVFEPGCDDDTSAGYLRSRADLIWLDGELVDCRSVECLKLIGAMRRDPSPELVTRLAEAYTGRYAVDFIYDDWASSFRETLHASYLDRIERAVTADTKAGAFDRALSVAQLALQADPDAEQIELCLLRLYRRMGAKAAAAEQYAHYAGVMRDQLGIEPPPLESI
jgi:DNA-binding SARP family transcriptional activator/tetratricopeptide (TPR) repeat protein